MIDVRGLLSATAVSCLGLLLAACDGSGEPRTPTATSVPSTATATPSTQTPTRTPGQGERACVESGGTLSTGPCCAGIGDFPNTCGIGACGCPPSGSRDVQLCACGDSRCFDGTRCVSRDLPTATAVATTTPTTVSTVLHGRVTDDSGQPLSGVMLTAYDALHAASVTVFTGVDGRYAFPELSAGSYRVRARRIGWNEAFADGVAVGSGGAAADFSLAPILDPTSQLPPTYFKSLLRWPSQRVAGDFSRACANCHQIGDFRWRKRRTRADWEAVINTMIGYGGVPFFQETRNVLLDTIASTFSPDAPVPAFAVPPPSGDALRAVIYEWEIDPERKPDCHDLELGLDGTVYTVGGVFAFNPRTGERASYPVLDGGHSIERDAHGDMWITAPGPEQIIKFDVTTKQFTSFDQPRIGDDVGSYPHTLRFDDLGRIWYTLTRSNHVCRFDPPTAQFTYYRLPPADPAISGVPIAAAYGLDVAPDQSVWWSQLYGHKIGRVDPVSGEVTAWRPPFDGPRRLFVGPDNVVWVPGYGSAELGRFDPASETWKVYELPTEPAGNDLPYAIGVNRANGDVWITGSDSDSLIRFRPDTEAFTVIPLPTAADFTREIEFDDDNAVWTCTSNQPIGPDASGTGRIIKVAFRERTGRCGDGIAQLGEGCDDGNTADCDGCSAACTVETGCGDGARCGGEACDDGNDRACDGCSPSCATEVGAACGDGTVNGACGEECDPPGELCTEQCRRVPMCGDGVMTAPEACDDGNTADCDGCSAACRVETGCGDGVRCGGEACDDGNALACDGCSPACMPEVGTTCGDGTVNAACGEQCDPPGADCSLICTAGEGVLGTRRMTFGGSFFSSALGISVPLGTLEGALELVGGRIEANGTAPVQVAGPVYYSGAILGGQYGTLCVRVDSCAGFIDCDGGSPVDTLMVQDSNGPGPEGLPITLTTGLGEDAPPGAVQLDCQQALVQLGPGQNPDCTATTFPPAQRIAYTTGTAEAFYLNGAPKIGNGSIRTTGEPFSCSAWQVTDGPGQLAGTFLFEDDPQAGDVANVNVLDD